jgi:AcrR family transcriptional regulator
MPQADTKPLPADARERLLSTAASLFYSVGIHSVGIERIVAEAKVTRATLYRHFPGKEDLVIAYLKRVDADVRRQVEQAMAGGTPADGILRAMAEAIAGDIRTPGFRGCAFLNAAAEFPEPTNPVHRAVLAHREWFLATVTGLFVRTHAVRPDDAGRHFVMLRDGVMAAGYLGDPASAGETFLRGIDDLIEISALPDR